MAHKNQKEFCERIRREFPERFRGKKVLDCGSLDINGNNKYLFTECEYIGIDIGPGKNVNVVTKIHEYECEDETFDLIISTECFEHDLYLEKSLKRIIKLLKKNGMFLFTCATTGRTEHGTEKNSPNDCPLTKEIKEWKNYYRNINAEDIMSIINVEEIFNEYEFQKNLETKDLYFFGIKR